MKRFSSPSIAIIVLNWQGWRHTQRCLESLLQLDLPYRLIVCDNDSQDDSIEQIQAWAAQHDLDRHDLQAGEIEEASNRQFTLIATGGNLGFAGGNNVGIRYALRDPALRYIWLLNNDTMVEPQALLALYQYAEAHPRQALIGSTLLELDDFDQRSEQVVQCAGGCRYWPLLTRFQANGAGIELNALYRTKLPRLDYVAGAAMFLRIEAINKTGLLEENYFLFYEELDYTQRLKQQGYDIGWCAESLVYHQGSGTVGTKSRDQLKRANYYENLSTLKYSYRFHRQWFVLIWLNRLVLKAIFLTIRRQWFLFPALSKAYWDFYRPKK